MLALAFLAVTRAALADDNEQLITQFEREQDDHGLRCWLLELIGAARSPAVLPVFAAQLDSSDESLRDHAAAGLKKLDTPEAGPCSGAPGPTAQSPSKGHDLRLEY